MPSAPSLKPIISEFLAFKGRISLSMTLLILTVFSGIGLLASSGYLISWAALQPPILDMILILVAVRFFGISRAAVRYGERLFSHDLTFRILKRLRVHFFRAVEPVLPSKSIRYGSADLLSRFSDDVDKLQELYLKVMAPVLNAGFFILITVIISAFFSPLLALSLAVIMLSSALFVPLFIRRMAGRESTQLPQRQAELGTYMADHIDGSADLMFSGQHAEWFSKGDAIIDEIAAQQQKRARAFSLESGLFTLLQHGSLPLSLLILLPLVLQGELSGLLMVALVLGIFSAFEAIAPVGNALQHWSESSAAAGRLQEITTADTHDEKQQQHKTAFHPKDSSIRFSGVSFSYDEDTEVLNGLDLHIPAGDHVLLTGPSGSGKSTLMHLLVKWFEPDSGELRIGGQSLRNVSGAEVRKHISVVGQHTRLFNTSLRQNLLIAKPGASDAELIEALEQVSFGPTLRRLPDGLDTQVGQLGLRLSGGERQRVAIARALLKEAPIWILDEPLSSLDTEMARDIYESLKKLTKGKTVIHITHQPGDLEGNEAAYYLHPNKKQLLKLETAEKPVIF
ncbi:MAG: thiol reductant ABC exporter subunit CydC [Cyclonatronaceae bacterium]